MRGTKSGAAATDAGSADEGNAAGAGTSSGGHGSSALGTGDGENLTEDLETQRQLQEGLIQETAQMAAEMRDKSLLSRRALADDVVTLDSTTD